MTLMHDVTRLFFLFMNISRVNGRYVSITIRLLIEASCIINFVCTNYDEIKPTKLHIQSMGKPYI
jgi:hypothetical protein